MQRLARLFVPAFAATALLFGCAGDMGTLDEGETGNVGTTEYSAKVLTIAHTAIIETRPQATALLVNKLNLVLANNAILGVTMQNLEGQVQAPLSNKTPENTCPYLTVPTGNTTITCRYLVDRAVEDTLGDSVDLQTGIEQDVSDKHQDLKVAELKFVKNWVGQAVLSGIDVGAIHTLVALRKTKVCDQAPTQQASAFKLGEGQGKALLEQTETAVLPTIPNTVCNTDSIAATVLAAAQAKIDTFVGANAVCAGFKASDLAETVDLTQAEKNRKNGITEGMRQAYEALRVRLVSSWQCVQPNTGDPLVVDLDGDGVKLAATRVPFDLAGNGDTVLMPALAGKDALLVIDRDGNGQVTDGSELFGNGARCGSLPCADGIAALAQHDSNKDGRIDAKDAVWSQLKLWRDANRDGKSDSSELSSPADHGIVAIRLDAKIAPWSDGKGSSSLRQVAFVRADGTSGNVHDVWFGVTFDQAPAHAASTGVTSTLFDRAR